MAALFVVLFERKQTAALQVGDFTHEKVDCLPSMKLIAPVSYAQRSFLNKHTHSDRRIYCVQALSDNK